MHGNHELGRRVRELMEGGHEQRLALLEDEHGDDEAYIPYPFRIRVTFRYEDATDLQ